MNELDHFATKVHGFGTAYRRPTHDEILQRCNCMVKQSEDAAWSPARREGIKFFTPATNLELHPVFVWCRATPEEIGAELKARGETLLAL